MIEFISKADLTWTKAIIDHRYIGNFVVSGKLKKSNNFLKSDIFSIRFQNKLQNLVLKNSPPNRHKNWI